MKTIIFIIGIVGLSVANASAQKMNCVCTSKKVAHHTTHHKKSTAHKTTKQTATAYTTKTTRTRYYNFKSQPEIALRASRGPACSIDSNGEIAYNSVGAYTGFYPPDDINCDPDQMLIPRFKDLIVTSPAIKNGVLPAKYSCQGEQVSPPLQVLNIPNGTSSLAIIMFDPHATPKKSTTYWVMWNLDTTGVIPENFVSDFETQNPVNKQYGYQAVCPAAGTHYYHFRVYALDTKLLLDRHATKATMENAMRGHVLAKGEMIAEYNRHLD